jgi:large subunit ribosomal protein L30e
MSETKIEEEKEEAAESVEEKEESTEAKEKRKKEKRIIRRRKQKKEAPVIAALYLLAESGKVEFGTKSALKNAHSGKVKAFVIAKNAPEKLREKLFNYCKSTNIPIIESGKTSLELGSIYGKPFPICVVSVFDEGSSNLLELVDKKTIDSEKI